MKYRNTAIFVLVFINLNLGLAYGKSLLMFGNDQNPSTQSYYLQKAAAAEPVKESVEPSDEYEVGVDDILDISIIKPEPMLSTVTVAPDGSITFPYIGNVQVKGMTLPKIQDEIQKRLANGYVEFPIVSASLRQTRSKKFVIYGQVVHPGTYPIEGNMTILRAITEAGGFIVPGGTGKVKILRPKPGVDKPDVIKSDISNILSGFNQNIAVLPGDTIIVSTDKFFIYGQILHPGAYPIEEDMTLMHAITVAGGFIESGSTGRVKLYRPKSSTGEYKVIDSDIKGILNGDNLNVTVLAGDTVVVTVDKFFISGQVNRPGAYPVEENMTLSRAITVAGGFAESSSTGKVKLLRKKVTSNDTGVIESDMASVLNGTNQDIPIFPGDSIVVSTDKFFVYGEVTRPGMFALETNTTALTAISMAGGFTKFGSASRVKVLRMNQKTGAYDTIKVNVNEIMSGSLNANVILKPQDILVVSEGAF